jgi:hypothetical protein
MAGRYKQPVQYGKGPPIKAGQPEASPHLGTACEIHHIYEDLNESSSARPGGSQQLEIPPSLNSKQAASFSSPAGFSADAGFFTRRGDFNAHKDSIVRLIFSESKDFLNPLGFLWLQIFVYIFSIYFSAFVIEYAPVFNWRNCFWPLGLRLIL